MKQIVFIIILIICSLNSICQINHSERFSISDFLMHDTLCPDNQTYKLFNTKADNKEMTSGMPELPVFYYRFIMPNGYVIDSITYIEADTSTLTLNRKMFPAQTAVPACIGCPSPVFKTPDSLVYSSSEPYPIRRTLINGNGIWHTANILTIGIYPYQYFPLTNKLSFAGRITTSIYYHINNGATQQTKKMLVTEYNTFVNDLQSMVENPSDVSIFLSGIEIINQLPVIDNFPIYQYVVIAPESFIGSEPLNRFVEWKKKKGVKIGVVSLTDLYIYCDANSMGTDDIGNTTTIPPNNNSLTGNEAKIRKYLQKMNDNGGCNYVLFIGDDTKVPVRKYYAYHDYDGQNYDPACMPTQAITDKYYADFTSDYNVDGDGNLGEFDGDKVDKHPECYVGRIPCSTIEELGYWIDKLVNYETDPGIGSTDYLGNFTLTMADEMQQGLQNSNSLFNNLSIFSLRNFKEIPNILNPDNPHGSDIINSLKNNPTGWWTWCNHGDIDKFLTMTYGSNNLPMSDINSTTGTNGILSLDNENKYGIIHSASCHVAYFPRADCILRSALFNSNGGFVSFSGNTDLGWTGVEDSRLIFLTQDIKSCHNGNDLNLTKICPLDWRWIISCTLNEYSYESYLTHNFFGDPEMMYYTKQPDRIVADLSSRHINASVTNNYQVTIKNLANGRHAIVCLYQPADGLHPEYQETIDVTPVNHQCVATFNIPAGTLNSGKMFVTVTSFDMMPFMDEILVSPGCTKNNTVEEIGTNTVYPSGSQIFKDHDVKVKAGATLTINGEAYFVGSAKICVMPGGKLVIDGGLIGSSCESLWEGVEVWGNTNLPQTVNNQGVISVMNGGKINDAVCAIRTAKMNGITTDPTTYGGIIRCNNASFINNKCAIRIYPYNQGAYNATINETNFLTNDHYMINSAPLPSEMFSIDGITGLNISKCTFNYSADFEGIDANNRGTGLLLTNCSVSLGNTDNTGSSFSNLTYGIKGTNTGGVRTPYIRYCIFEHNLRGIYLSGYYGAVINRNSFNTLQDNDNYISSGLYLDACTGYSVQENTFEGHYSGNNTYETGIIINNSGTAPNEIYNNTFTNLQNGITAQDDNRGLVCKCNDYAGVKTDQSVLITGGSSNTIGIALYQGDGLSVSGPAGNTFSLRSSGTGDIYNQGVRFNYYHHQDIAQLRLEPKYYEKVDLIPYNFENYTKQAACPSKLGGGGGINQEQIKDELASTDLLIQQKQDSLIALIDGGNTEETTEDVIYSSPQEALDLRDDLLAKSPYLSDTVMQTAIANEYVLPNAMVRDILVANPQSATSDPVLDELDKRIDPMPDEMYNQILDGELIVSPKETKEAELASLKLARETNYNTLVSFYLADTAGLLSDSLDQLLISENKPEAKYLLACKQLSAGDTVVAESTLAAIPATFNLSPAEMNRHENYLSYFAIVNSMMADTLPGYQCDSLQLVALNLPMQEGYEPVSSYARNILIANGVLIYNEPYLVAEEMKSTRAKRERRNITTPVVPLLTLSPNPCRNFVIVGYSLENNSATDAFLTINTLQGVEIKTIQLTGAKDQVVIALNNFSPGIYVASLKAGGKLMDSKKIIIVK